METMWTAVAAATLACLEVLRKIGKKSSQHSMSPDRDLISGSSR